MRMKITISPMFKDLRTVRASIMKGSPMFNSFPVHHCRINSEVSIKGRVKHHVC